MACDPALERELVESWDWIVEFYEDLLTRPHWQWIEPLRDLILELRDAGYDRQLRAGQSMHIFVASRSRVHGLREDQACISMEAWERDRSLHVAYGTRNDVVPLDGEIHPAVRDLLDQLVMEPID